MSLLKTRAQAFLRWGRQLDPNEVLFVGEVGVVAGVLVWGAIRIPQWWGQARITRIKLGAKVEEIEKALEVLRNQARGEANMEAAYARISQDRAEASEEAVDRSLTSVYAEAYAEEYAKYQNMFFGDIALQNGSHNKT